MTVTTAVSPAFGQLRCDRDMLELLQAYESLGPAALDRRTDPLVARGRPGMAEAIRAVLQQHQAAPARAPSACTTAAAKVVTSHDVNVNGAAGRLAARWAAGMPMTPLPAASPSMRRPS
jgi:hypothetical protein